MLKGQKGITLVALVITIIVLLILAGVTIAALSGDNGILTNATEAKTQNAIGNAKDIVSMAINEATNAYYDYTYLGGNQTTSAGTVTATNQQATAKSFIETAATNFKDAEIKVSDAYEVSITVDGKTITADINTNGGLEPWSE